MGQSVNREVCKKLIQQCGGLDFFPADKEVRTLLVDTLQRVAASEDHATRMISRWLEEDCLEIGKDGTKTRRAPTVADIVALSRTIVAAAATKAPSGCEVCMGSGWMTVEKNGVLGSKRCDCARGRHFAEMDKQRLAGTLK